MIMNKKSIIFLIDSPFPYYSGGIETWLYNVAIRLNDRYRIIVISESPIYYKSPIFHLPHDIIVENFFSIRKYKLCRGVLKGFLSYIEFQLHSYFMSYKLFKVIEKYGNSVVVALNTLNAASAVYNVKKQFKDIYYVCSARGPHADIMSQLYPKQKKKLFDQEKRNMQYADCTWVNGYDMLSYFQSYGIKAKVMKNGVNIELFKNTSSVSPFSNSDLKILSVATLLDIKCISELIIAFSDIVNRGYENISLYFIGKGDSLKYRKLANSLHVTDKVYFLGNKTDVIPYMKNVDIIACLSGGGGLSMAALEAMASKTPVIAWDTPVYRQFNRKQKVIELVPEKDTEALADGIEHMLHHYSLYQNMGERAFEEANFYDWNIVVNDFINDIS